LLVFFDIKLFPWIHQSQQPFVENDFLQLGFKDLDRDLRLTKKPQKIYFILFITI